MTIYSDAIDNKFLGDCIWANNDINYPTTKFLQAHPHSDVSAELTALLTASGLQFRNVLSQASFDSGASNSSLLTFGTISDTINDRYNFQCANFVGVGLNGGGSGTLIQMYNDTGYTATNNTFSATNSIFGLSNMPSTISSNGVGSFQGLGFQAKTDSNSFIQCVGVANNESLVLFFYQYNFTSNNFRTALYYAGTVDAVNTNFSYYDANITTKSIAMCIRTENNFYTSGREIFIAHRIANTAKYCLTTGDAQYPIVCADGQNPTSQWATDFYVFDNNSTLGFPAIGRVRNLLLAQGTYTIGKPVKIQGSAMPDAGFNRWIPVGSYAGKTVLDRKSVV
jgi:hypothetical protein